MLDPTTDSRTIRFSHQIWSLPRGAGADPVDPPAYGDPEMGRFALASGASRSVMARDWAQLLARHACIFGLPDDDDYNRWMREAHAEWRDRFDRSQGELPELGAAALGAVEVHPEEGGFRWRALCQGDVCAFWIRDRSAIERFPHPNTEAFGFSVESFFSEPIEHPYAPNQLLRSGRAGDRIALATEALSRWLYARIDAGRDPWARLLQLQDQDAFRRLVQHERERGAIADEDTVLLVLRAERADARDRSRMMTLIPELDQSARDEPPLLYALPSPNSPPPASDPLPDLPALPPSARERPRAPAPKRPPPSRAPIEAVPGSDPPLYRLPPPRQQAALHDRIRVEWVEPEAPTPSGGPDATAMFIGQTFAVSSFQGDEEPSLPEPAPSAPPRASVPPSPRVSAPPEPAPPPVLAPPTASSAPPTPPEPVRAIEESWFSPPPPVPDPVSYEESVDDPSTEDRPIEAIPDEDLEDDESIQRELATPARFFSSPPPPLHTDSLLPDAPPRETAFPDALIPEEEEPDLADFLEPEDLSDPPSELTPYRPPPEPTSALRSLHPEPVERVDWPPRRADRGLFAAALVAAVVVLVMANVLKYSGFLVSRDEVDSLASDVERVQSDVEQVQGEMDWLARRLARIDQPDSEASSAEPVAEPPEPAAPIASEPVASPPAEPAAAEPVISNAPVEPTPAEPAISSAPIDPPPEPAVVSAPIEPAPAVEPATPASDTRDPWGALPAASSAPVEPPPTPAAPTSSSLSDPWGATPARLQPASGAAPRPASAAAAEEPSLDPGSPYRETRLVPAEQDLPAALSGPLPEVVQLLCLPEVCAMGLETVELYEAVTVWDLSRENPMAEQIGPGVYPRDPRQVSVRDRWVRVRPQ